MAFVLVRFLEDNILFVCPTTDTKVCDGVTVAKYRGRFYPAVIIYRGDKKLLCDIQKCFKVDYERLLNVETKSAWTQTKDVSDSNKPSQRCSQTQTEEDAVYSRKQTLGTETEDDSKMVTEVWLSRPFDTTARSSTEDLPDDGSTLGMLGSRLETIKQELELSEDDEGFAQPLFCRWRRFLPNEDEEEFKTKNVFRQTLPSSPDSSPDSNPGLQEIPYFATIHQEGPEKQARRQLFFSGETDEQQNRSAIQIAQELEQSEDEEERINVLRRGRRFVVNSDSSPEIDQFQETPPSPTTIQQFPVMEEGRRSSSSKSDDMDEQIIHSDDSENTSQVKSREYKKHACFFCNSLFKRVPRHWATAHKTETKVIKILTTQDSLLRKQMVQELINIGDYNYNIKALTTGEGGLIVSRWDSGSNPQDYGPCPHCLKFLKKRNLWKHGKQCAKKQSDPGQKISYISESTALITSAKNPLLHTSFQKDVVKPLRSDKEGEVVRSDELILKFGLDSYECHGPSQSEMIRQNMRQLARLVLHMKTEDRVPKLREVISVEGLNSIVQTVKEMCEVEAHDAKKRPKFQRPSIALKLGYHLKSCAQLLRGEALITGDLALAKSYKHFLFLFESIYRKKISSNALTTLRHNKINAEDCLPITDDLIKIDKFVRSKMLATQKSLAKRPTQTKWYELAHLTLVRIVLFNKRRGGEAAKMTTEEYLGMRSWSSVSQLTEIRKSLTALEIKLAESVRLVQIIGKRGSIVPVIITGDMFSAMQLLQKTRFQVNVRADNPYFFARVYKGSITHIRGSDALSKIVSWCPQTLEQPKFIKGTQIRKYTATVCQLLELKENEMDWLARHLGHNISVHRDFYRLHHSAIEMTKMTRLLLAVEDGSISKFAGKSLNDISLADLPPITAETEETEETQDSLPSIERPDAEASRSYLGSIEDHSEIEQIPIEENPPKRARSSGSPSGSEYIASSPEERHKKRRRKSASHSESPVSSERDSPVKRRKKRRKLQKHVPWTPSQKKYLIDYFKSPMKHGCVPGKEAILQAMSAQPQKFINRKWTDVKNFAHNFIKKLKTKKHFTK